MATIVDFDGWRPRIAARAFLAPTAVIIGDVEIGEDASIWYGAVLRGDLGPIRIGAGSNLQDNVVVHVGTPEGTVLAERVTVGHGAILHDCWIGRDTLIGMGAVLLERSRIGSGCMIGAGSVVRENFTVPDGMLAVGNPAVVKKPIEGAAAQWIARGADDYLQLAARYRGLGRSD